MPADKRSSERRKQKGGRREGGIKEEDFLMSATWTLCRSKVENRRMEARRFLPLPHSCEPGSFALQAWKVQEGLEKLEWLG